MNTLAYNEWLNKAEAIESINVNRSTVRDIYQFPNNVRVIENTVFPWSIFKQNYSYVWLDLILPKTPEIEFILNKFNGETNENIYTDDGYFTPEFREIDNEPTPMERAFNFSIELKRLRLDS